MSRGALCRREKSPRARESMDRKERIRKRKELHPSKKQNPLALKLCLSQWF